MSLTQEPQITILNRSSKLMDILVGVSASSGPNDAFMPVVLNSAGVLDQTITGTGVAAVAQGALPAGSLIHLFDNAGTLTARLASAAANPNQFLATGFVVASYNDAEAITAVLSGRYVYNDGIAEFSAGDIGVEVFLSATTPGHITKTAPSGGGQADQVVGYVVGFTAGTPNLVAVSFGTGVRDFSQLDGVCQINQGGTGATTAAAALTNLLTGTYAINKVLASPSSGGTGNITLRSLVAADIPDLSATYDLAGAAATALTNAEAYTDAHVKVFEATTHLTSANLLALRATPITVIPAPAAGKFIRVIALTAQYKFNSTAFTVGADNLGFRYVGGSSDFAGIPVTGLIDQTHSEVAFQNPNTSFLATQTGVSAVAIQVHNTGGAEWTLGNGDVFLTLLYEVITLN
jgi:hypothetical protein